jgi:flagellar protein FlgJ
MLDYVNFVQSNPRYQQALEHTQKPQAYFSELQKAGYATDPEYANKIISVLESKQFSEYLP